MKFFVDNWHLILVALTSGAFLLWPAMRKASGGPDAVSTGEAVRLINREKGVLIDVSEPREYADGHAVGARNVPLGDIAKSKDLPTNKTLPLLLMCPSGTRSRRAAAQLRKAGYDKAAAVAGGTAAWREAQLPLARAATADKAA